MTAPRELAPAICRSLPGSESELMRLVNAMCEGTATHADAVALETLLADPANRDFYLAAMELHTSLLWRWHADDSAAPTHRGPADPAGSSTSRNAAASKSAGAEPSRRFAAAVGSLRRSAIAWTRALSRPVPLSCLVAAAVLGSVIGAAAIAHIRRAADAEGSLAAATRAGRLATITGLHDVAWSAGATAHARMAGLAAGDTIEVDRGLVELSYDSGALVVIEGPARYQVRGKVAGRLTSGRVTTKTVHPKSRPGTTPEPLFTIVTPSGVIHDLGTEFGTEVHRSSGLAAVHVFEGLVELAVADRATTPDARFVRLVAGEAARMDDSGKIVPAPASLRQRFVRSLPKPADDKQVASTVWKRIGWNDATAVTIYRDSFRGTGPLAGTTPASRGGIGQEAWTAPAQGWDLTADGLAVHPGNACAWLPFTPQPDRLYRLTVEMHTTGGGMNWLAAGFVSSPSIHEPIQLAAGASIWFLQRHQTGLSARNQVKAASNRMIDVDTAAGPVTRAVVIDTRPPATAHFLLGDRLLRSEPLASCDSLAAAVLSTCAASGVVRGFQFEMSTIETASSTSVSTTRAKTGTLP